MKSTILLAALWLFSLGMSASTEAEVSVYRLIEDQLEPINVKVQITDSKGESQAFSTHDQGRSYFDLSEGEFKLEVVSDNVPHFEVPLVIDKAGELNSFFFTLIFTDLLDSNGELVGMQISSFHKKEGHLCQAYEYSIATQKMIQLIEFDRGAQPELLVNSSIYYSSSPSEMRDVISAGNYAMDHDEVSNVYFSDNGEYSFLTSTNEKRYASVVMEHTGIANAKSFTTFAEEDKSTAKPVMVSEENSYSVQLGVFRRRVKARNGEFLVKDREGRNVLCKGQFTSYQEAKTFKEQLLDSGAEGVFVIGLKNGDKVPVSEM